MNRTKLTAWIVRTTLLSASVSSLFAQQKLIRYDLSRTSQVLVTTDLVVAGQGIREYAFVPFKDANVKLMTASDRSTGKTLAMHHEGSRSKVVFDRALNGRAELRLGIQQSVPAKDLIQTEGDHLFFRHALEKGAHVIVLPVGYVVKSCSLPAQIQTEGSRVQIGVIQPNDASVPVTIAASQANSGQDMKIPGTFRVFDDRAVTYELQDPATSQIKLWLEIYVTSPHQSHFYSELRLEDAIRPLMTIDMDRGVELPTRILSGKDANAIGDAPSPFPETASVLTADLGYAVPDKGSARVRSYQVATDVKNYRLQADGTFRLDRFLARTHSTYVVPSGWELSSVDQPGSISRDAQGRVVLDFPLAGADTSKLIITGRRLASK